MYNRFQGDPAIKITPNGADMKLINGQPVLDQGLENAVNISLFTKSGYWGNSTTTEESKKIGSDYEKQCAEPITKLASIINITDAAEKAMEWMKKNGLASVIDITVTNPNNNKINTDIKITPPGSDIKRFIFSKNGMSWQGQSLHPAHSKMEDI